MSTLAERLELVLRAKAHIISSYADWARKAHVSDQYLSAARARNGTLALDKAARLAAVVGIDLQWLADGQGPMDRVPPEDVWPERARGAALARAEGVPGTVIAEVCQSDRYNRPKLATRTADWWRKEFIEAAWRAEKRAKQDELSGSGTRPKLSPSKSG